MVLESRTVLRSVASFASFLPHSHFPVLSTPLPPSSNWEPFSLVSILPFLCFFCTHKQTHAYFHKKMFSFLHESESTTDTLLHFAFFTENILWKSLYIHSLRPSSFFSFTVTQHCTVFECTLAIQPVSCGGACRLLPVVCSSKQGCNK